MGIVISIEINPPAFRAAGLDSAGPYRELGLRVIVPIPTLRAMQADVNFIGSLDELIGQARAAARAEDDTCLAEGAVNFFIPPTGVPEFHDVATGRIELANNIIEASVGVAISSEATETRNSPFGRRGYPRSSQNPLRELSCP